MDFQDVKVVLKFSKIQFDTKSFRSSPLNSPLETFHIWIPNGEKSREVLKKIPKNTFFLLFWHKNQPEKFHCECQSWIKKEAQQKTPSSLAQFRHLKKYVLNNKTSSKKPSGNCCHHHNSLKRWREVENLWKTRVCRISKLKNLHV